MARADRYVKPIRRVTLARNVLLGAATVALIGSHLLTHPFGHNWLLRLLTAIAAVQLLDLVIVTPFQAWRELAYDKRWGFSTQTTGGFVADTFKGIPVGIALFALLLVPLWAVIRATSLWWLFGWAVFAFFLVGIGILFPIVVFPLFNKYTPLEEGDLRGAILATAQRVGADIEQVLVEDSSKRDTRPNAYVAGLGKVRRVVLFDNILRYPTDAVLSVVAHEIGHWKMRHILRSVPTALASSFVGFLVLKLVLDWKPALDFAGVRSLRDPAASVLFQLVFFSVLAPVTGLVGAWLSRAHERQADLFALETVGNHRDLVAFFRDVSVENLADLHPTWLRRIRQTHPPFAERMALATAWAAPTSASAASTTSPTDTP